MKSGSWTATACPASCTCPALLSTAEQVTAQQQLHLPQLRLPYACLLVQKPSCTCHLSPRWKQEQQGAHHQPLPPPLPAAAAAAGGPALGPHARDLQRSSYDQGSTSSSRASSPTEGYRAPPRAVIHAMAGYDVCDSAGSSDISRITPLRIQVRGATRCSGPDQQQQCQQQQQQQEWLIGVCLACFDEHTKRIKDTQRPVP